MKHPSWRIQATPKSYIWLTSLQKSNDVLRSDLRNSHKFTKLCMHLEGNRFCSNIQKEGQTLYLWLHPPPPPVEGCDMWPQWMERTVRWCSGSNPTWNYVPGKKRKKESVLGVHLYNLTRLQVSIKWTYQSTFPARPSLVLNNAESLKSDVNIRWPQLAWAVRWYSSSASVFSLPPEHERHHQIRHQNETQRISLAECANYAQLNRLNLYFHNTILKTYTHKSPKYSCPSYLFPIFLF